jgi:hypothetical protein
MSFEDGLFRVFGNEFPWDLRKIFLRFEGELLWDFGGGFCTIGEMETNRRIRQVMSQKHSSSLSDLPVLNLPSSPSNVQTVTYLHFLGLLTTLLATSIEDHN